MPDLPGGSSAAPGLVPEHMGDDRRAMILDHHGFHPIVEAEGGDVGIVGGAGEGCREDGQCDQGKAKHLGSFTKRSLRNVAVSPPGSTGDTRM